MKNKKFIKIIANVFIIIAFLSFTWSFVLAKDPLPVAKDCSELSGCTGSYGCSALEWWASPDCKISCTVGMRYCPNGSSNPGG